MLRYHCITTSYCNGQSHFSERNLLHFAVTLASGGIPDEGYAPLCFARSGAAVPANEEIYVVLYEYAAQVITVNVCSYLIRRFWTVCFIDICVNVIEETPCLCH